jgi:hypothetical protein
LRVRSEPELVFGLLKELREGRSGERGGDEKGKEKRGEGASHSYLRGRINPTALPAYSEKKRGAEAPLIESTDLDQNEILSAARI